MIKLSQKTTVTTLTALACCFIPQTAQAQSPATCQSTVTVAPGDTLGEIAKRAYGSSGYYQRIVVATNAQAALDNSYTRIDNPNRIEPGMKLCIPGGEISTPGVTPPTTTPTPSDDTTRITLLQVNDVYEMTPVGGQGGMARLTTLKKQLKSVNPNTYSVLSGDVFSPSALGTAKVDGERLAGKQMVAAFNAFGLDFATFGNHEFDIKEEQFRDRMSETETRWFSSNVFEADGTPFKGVPSNLTFSVTGANGDDVTVGMFGVTMDSNPADYVSYTDPFEAAEMQIRALDNFADVLVAVTHLPMGEDIELAKRFPQLDLVIGGHEHENAIEKVGPTGTYITKADANARTAYIIDIDYDHNTDAVTVRPRLQAVTSDIPDDPAVAKVVDDWLEKGFDGFRQAGFKPMQTVTTITDELDGTEATVRNRSSKLTELIADAMLVNAREGGQNADISMYNGGSIRIDDTILPGAITEYDVIRILPFGGTIFSVEFTGSILQKTLDQGERNAGIGGYLQTAGVTKADGNWMINGEALNPSRTYIVAVNDFLMTGFEQDMEFLKLEDNPDLNKVAEHDDLRKALITQLKIVYGG